MMNEPLEWYVEYKIPGMSGDTVLRSGPYTESTVVDELNDIATFDGVEEAVMVQEPIE